MSNGVEKFGKGNVNEEQILLNSCRRNCLHPMFNKHFSHYILQLFQEDHYTTEKCCIEVANHSSLQYQHIQHGKSVFTQKLFDVAKKYEPEKEEN